VSAGTPAAGSARKIAEIMQALETETDSAVIARLHRALEQVRRPRQDPPRRSLPPASPDEARARLKALADARNISLAALSRMLSRRDRYLEVFVREGHPVHLSRRDRELLAAFLRVGAHELGDVDNPSDAPLAGKRASFVVIDDPLGPRGSERGS
jgi:hypothetical protein